LLFKTKVIRAVCCKSPALVNRASKSAESRIRRPKSIIGLVTKYNRDSIQSFMPRILLLGASGTGTTSTAKILAAKFGCFHGDSDTYFWVPSDPPFTTPRTYDKIQDLLVPDLERHLDFVLSGSFCGWGDAIIPYLDFVFLLVAPTDLRLQRIMKREQALRGSQIEAGGSEHAKFNAFLEWSRAYDVGGVSRSRKLHDDWMGNLSCKKAVIDSSKPHMPANVRICCLT